MGVERYVQSVRVSTAAARAPQPPLSQVLLRLNEFCEPRRDMDFQDRILPGPVLVDAISDWVIGYPDRVDERWAYLPWDDYNNPDLAKLYYVLIAFADNHRVSIDRSYYPTEILSEDINRLVNSGIPLNPINQLDLLDRGDGSWSTIYRLALAWRYIARDTDNRPFPCETRPNIDLGQRVSVLKRLPPFPQGDFRPDSKEDRNIAVVGGDWYHYWTKTALVGAEVDYRFWLKEHGEFDFIYKSKLGAFEWLMQNSAGVSNRLRGGKVECGDHWYADDLGGDTGIRIARLKHRVD